MALAKAKLWNVSVNPPVATDVMFNPTDYGIDRGANYAELDVPGLKTPVLQFVRGEAQTLSLSLFLDGSDARQPVKDALTALRQFICINGDLHTPPVCLFV
jgi:Contractile injection system tube protein